MLPTAVDWEGSLHNALFFQAKMQLHKNVANCSRLGGPTAIKNQSADSSTLLTLWMLKI